MGPPPLPGGTTGTSLGGAACEPARCRMLETMGVDPRAVTACDSRGLLHEGRRGIKELREAFYDKWKICRTTDPGKLTGDPGAAFKGADVCIAFSQPQPGVTRPGWVRTMNRGAIVFACANPAPEMWPAKAAAAGVRIVATGRGDFPTPMICSMRTPLNASRKPAGQRRIFEAGRL